MSVIKAQHVTDSEDSNDMDAGQTSVGAVALHIQSTYLMCPGKCNVIRLTTALLCCIPLTLNTAGRGVRSPLTVPMISRFTV